MTGRASGRSWGPATVVVLATLAACSSSGAPDPGTASGPDALIAPRAVPPGELDASGREWVDSVASSLPIERLAAQLVIPWVSGSYASPTSSEFVELLDWVERGIGGVSISIGLPHSYADKLNRLQAAADVPLLVTSDFENGGPGMRINHSYALPSLLPQGGGTSFPPTMAFGAIGDPDAAFEYGRITAREARAVGVHVIFAPVLDVNSNPLNPVINTRSFGEDPDAVARLGTAFIRGIRDGGAYATAKHFPGHGDTDVDSHISLPVVRADRRRLDRVELVPFRAAVDAGVAAVMTAHVAMPALLGEDAPPATLSPELMHELLRDEMGFEGLLFTDALRMGAITEAYGAGEAAVLALEAGSDVLLAPTDVPETIAAVVGAVQSGRLSRARLEESAVRILALKAGAGLHLDRLVPLELVSKRVGTGKHLQAAEEAASRSITLPRDRGRLVPLEPSRHRRVLSVTWARDDDLLAGRAFDALLARYMDEVTTVRVGPRTDPSTLADLAQAARGADRVVVSAYVPPRSGVGSVALPAPFADFVNRVDRLGTAAIVSFGSPYLLTSFPEVGTYVVAWGDREVSQEAAVRAIVGDAAIDGKLPVSIPPLHEIGDGLERAARDVSLKAAGNPLAEAGFVPAPRSVLDAASDAAAEVVCLRWERSPSDPAAVASDCPRASLMAVTPDVTAAGEVGMDPGPLAALDTLILGAVADGATPGAALAVGRYGRLVKLRGYGRLDWDGAAAPVQPTSIFDLASLTKVVATTTAAMILVDEGRLDLDERVVTYLPWWDEGDPGKARVTVRQLLLHRAGLPSFRQYYQTMDGPEAYRYALGAELLEYEPGEETVYSDIGLMTVGYIVEELTGRSLDSFVAERIWEPLGMTDTGFRPGAELRPRILPTEVDTVYRHTHVHGVVHDENAYAIGGVAGHAGLFSSARDLTAFALTIRNRGLAPHCGSLPAAVPCSEGEPERIVESRTVAEFTERYDETSSRALGWDTPSGRSSAGDYFTDRAFGHTGFTGTSLWIDPELDLFVVLLTARVNPTRENSRHVPLRRAVHDLAALSIADRPVAPRGS